MKRTVHELFGAGNDTHTQDEVNRMLVAAICASVGSLLSDRMGPCCVLCPGSL